MTIDEILEIIANSPSIPTLPDVATKVLSLSSKEDISTHEVAELISTDASISAKILKTANSALYGFPFRIRTILQAVSRIGLNATQNLVLSSSFLSMQSGDTTSAFNHKKFLEKSLAASSAAKLIMEVIPIVDSEEIFLAALLQDIGELLLANTFPKQYAQVIKSLSQKKNNLIALEQQFIGVDHTLVGYEVAKNWCFPNVFLASIKYHHHPERYDGESENIKFIIHIVHLSGLIANIIHSEDPLEFHKKFCEKSKALLKINDETILKILKQVDTEIEQFANSFDVKIEKPRPIEDILLEANAALGRINITYEQMNKELDEKNKELDKLVNIDAMTGVYNYRFLQTFLEKEVKRALRKKEVVSLIFLDIDYFKGVNDTYGHQVGDVILKEICTLVKKHLRDYEILARYGGEEFAIVLTEITKEAAKTLAERIRAKIEEYTFLINDRKFNVTASFGVAEIKPDLDNYEKDDLIRFADKALLESKNKGRNRVTVYTTKRVDDAEGDR
ncbi:MAG: GGDEF domain-containing protein [Candidatus Brocadiaceae bacterium]|nr:GGDEF domain-containing protein [Candidatus Brocadiaceae bacterium]